MSIKGVFRKLPSISVNNNTIIVSGNFIKIAVIKDEFWSESNLPNDLENIIGILKQKNLYADIFNFTQHLPDTQPIYDYHREAYSVAAIPITSFDDWWENRLSQVTRKNIRRATRRGVAVKSRAFDDQLIKEIVKINNETPIRSGRRFWHYGKNFESVKKDYSDFLDRSEFLGAYFDNQLIGFLRLIFAKETANIIQLLCMNKHHDKRPANALIARAVELCVENRNKYLTYGQYIYDGYDDSPLTEFKRRNGFEQFLVPSYYVPLTLKGNMLIKLNLHLGLKKLVPGRVLNMARGVRAKLQKLAIGNADIEESE